jgi:adenylate cyclase
MAFEQWHLTERFPWLAKVRESALKLWRPLVVTSFLVTGGTLGMRYLGLMQPAELAVYDQLVRLKPAEPADDRILVVGITENDLQILQESTISDQTLFRALTSLQQHSPETIAIDIFRDFPHEPGWQDLIGELQQNTNSVIICKVSAPDDPGVAPPPNIPKEQVGFSDLVVDPGGILRRSLLLAGTLDYDFPVEHLCNRPGETHLSLSLQTVIRYLEAQGIAMSFTEEGQMVLGSTPIPDLQADLGGYQRADTGGYQIMLHYRADQGPVPEVSLMEVINNQVDPELIRDRIVFVGYTNPLLKDTFYTPYSAGKDDKQQMPGVVIHAQAASQLISAVLDGRPLIWGWSEPFEIVWILAWSLVGGLLGWYLRHPAAVALVMLIGGASLYGAGFLIFLEGGWIPLVPAAVTFFGTAVGVVLLDRFNNSAYGQQVYKSVKNFLHLDIDIDEEKLEQQVTEITETDYFRELQDTVKTLRDQPEAEEASPPPHHWKAGQTSSGWDHQRDGNGDLSHRLDMALHPDDDSNQTASEEDGEFGFLNAIKAQSQAMKADLATPQPDSQEEEELDFLDGIKAQSQAMKADLQEAIGDRAAELPGAYPAGDSSEATHPPAPTDDYEFDFIQQLNQQAQRLRPSGERDDVAPQAMPPNSEPQKSNFSSETGSQPERHAFWLDAAFCEYQDTSPVSQDHMADLTHKINALRAGAEIEQNRLMTKKSSPYKRSRLPYLTPVNNSQPR